MGKHRICFLAHEISPYLGSECSSGWNISRGLSKYHDLTIIYAKTNQFQTENYEEQINEYFISNNIEFNARYLCVQQPAITLFIARINRFISQNKSSTGNSVLYFLAYKFWQKKAFKLFKFEHKIQKFDIVHQFNCLSFREPGYLFKANVPLVLGPISGFDKMPFSFLIRFPFSMFLKNFIRNLSNDIQFLTSFRIRKSIKKARIVYAVTKMDFQKMYLINKNTINLLDVGAVMNENKEIRKYDPYKEKLKCIWVGRLDKLKALDILISSIYQSEILQQKIELLVVGDGVCKEEYENLIHKFKLSNIKFIGSVSKFDVGKFMNESHVLIHTSIKEAASAVILEGMASGLPIICHDAFGMSYAVSDNCGIKVKFETQSQSISGFRKSLELIVENPFLVSKLSEGSYSRAKELSWEGNVQKISNDYLKILN
jgi:glycosyltransferase involved in cell wall biosynthesis